MIRDVQQRVSRGLRRKTDRIIAVAGLAMLAAVLTMSGGITSSATPGSAQSSPGYAVSNAANPSDQTTTVTLNCTPATAAVFQTVSCSVSTTAPFFGAPTQNVEISWGDSGSTFTPVASGSVATHAYSSTGTYTVTAYSVGSSGVTGQATFQIGITTTSGVGSVLPPGSPNGVTITYPAGWDLVGGPIGTVLANTSSSLYTYQANDSNYEVLPPGTPLTSGVGYWVQFTVTTTESIPLTFPRSMMISLPPSHFVMVSNPGSTPASLSGADLVLTYDPIQGYVQTSTLNPGQGAWALSFYGGTLTITNAP